MDSEGAVSCRLNDLRNESAEAAPVFVHSTENLGAIDYERLVHIGQIPTRDISHDWYNGQVWLAFPKVKQLINTLHVQDAVKCAEQPGRLPANGRSRLRDALTLFDESGALLLTTEWSLCNALLQHDWRSLLLDQRGNWDARAKVLLLGHGLLDSMSKAHKGLCAKVVPVQVPSLDIELPELQRLLLFVVEQLRAPGNLSPLPVMGVPGWFRDSERPGFYDDSSVYRAKPTRGISSSHERLAFIWDGSTLTPGKCVGQSLPEFQGEESPDSSEHGAC
ncbi:MAG: DUF3025 domain-containing protein [Gammaproteobacteria bacterium]|nr:DUF3025 domain-containing protein [Gammaproteobacteria bacterium]